MNIYSRNGLIELNNEQLDQSFSGEECCNV